MSVKAKSLVILLTLWTAASSLPGWAASDREAWNQRVAEIDALHQEQDVNKVLEATENFLTWARRQWGKGHPNHAEALSMTAKLHFLHNRWDKVEGMLRESLAIRERVYGREHLKTVDALEALAAFYIADERMDDAEPVLRATLEGRRRLLGGEHPLLADYMGNSARLYQRLKLLDRAETLFREALALLDRIHAPADGKREDAMIGLAEIATERGDMAQAESWYERALQWPGIEGDAGRLKKAQIRGQLGIMLWRTGREAQARQLGEQALNEARAIYGNEPARLAVWLSNLGRLHYKNGDYAQASLLLNEALASAGRQYGSDPANGLIKAIRRNLETLHKGVVFTHKGESARDPQTWSEGERKPVSTPPSGAAMRVPGVSNRPGRGAGAVSPTGPAGAPSRPGAREVVQGEAASGVDGPTGEAQEMSGEVDDPVWEPEDIEIDDAPLQEGSDAAVEAPISAVTQVSDQMAAFPVSAGVPYQGGGAPPPTSAMVEKPNLERPARASIVSTPSGVIPEGTGRNSPDTRGSPGSHAPLQGSREIHDDRGRMGGGEGSGRMPRRNEYYLSTGCFGESEFLHQARDRIKQLALPGFYTRVHVRGGQLTCVFVGPYSEEGAAQRAMVRLRGDGGMTGLEMHQATKDW
ncbi:MAG: tetratricopeptide repeat protein [Magnetococcales bacterium]|nr:tetratricopeptide repeat protein [Magnetococcales bacterium]MBF0322203.1 tetratricopeptide repeat protein [Magnetococcales bacterium]